MTLTRNQKGGIAAVVAVALVAAGAAVASTKIHSGSSSGARFGGGPRIGGSFPGPPGDFGRAGRPDGGLSAAASYLGISESDLFSQLAKGTTLAAIAKATSGKSVDGLVAAIAAAQKQQIEQAVSSGRLTRSQADRIESELQQRVTDMVNGSGFGGRGFDPDGDHGGGAAPTTTTPPTHI